MVITIIVGANVIGTTWLIKVDFEKIKHFEVLKSHRVDLNVKVAFWANLNKSDSINKSKCVLIVYRLNNFLSQTTRTRQDCKNKAQIGLIWQSLLAALKCAQIDKNCFKNGALFSQSNLVLDSSLELAGSLRFYALFRKLLFMEILFGMFKMMLWSTQFMFFVVPSLKSLWAPLSLLRSR